MRPEEAFQQQVIDLAHLYGWRVAHFRPAQTARGWRTAVAADGAGFPDLVMVRGSELLFAELKAARGRLSDDQRDWLRDLHTVSAAVEATFSALIGTGTDQPPPCVEVFVWRPADFDEIHRRLARPSTARRSAA